MPVATPGTQTRSALYDAYGNPLGTITNPLYTLGATPIGTTAPLPVSSSTEADTFEQILAELRVIRAAMIKLACDDGRALPIDFIQTQQPADAETLTLNN